MYDYTPKDIKIYNELLTAYPGELSSDNSVITFPGVATNTTCVKLPFTDFLVNYTGHRDFSMTYIGRLERLH